jgi:hypothetical protein
MIGLSHSAAIIPKGQRPRSVSPARIMPLTR